MSGDLQYFGLSASTDHLLRLCREEREQREADERVESLKKRLLAVRAAKKAGSGTLKTNGEPQSATSGLEETARERRRRRLGK